MKKLSFVSQIWKKIYILGSLDGQKHQNADLFKSVISRLQDASFPTQTVEQVSWTILKKKETLLRGQTSKQKNPENTETLNDYCFNFQSRRPVMVKK